MEERRKSYRFSRRLKISVWLIVFVLMLVLFSVRAYQDWAYICENTASRKGYRVWWGGWESGHWYQASALELFMREHYPNELTHRWTSYAGTGKNIFGFVLLRSHGRPGPILGLRPDTLTEYFSMIDNPQKKALYDLFARGDKQAIDAEVEKIFEQVIRRNTPSGGWR